MASPPPVQVRIVLAESSKDFVDALGDLLAAVRDADEVLVEDSIVEAAERVVDALRAPEAIAVRKTDDPGPDMQPMFADSTEAGPPERWFVFGTPWAGISLHIESMKRLARVGAWASLAAIILWLVWRG